MDKFLLLLVALISLVRVSVLACKALCSVNSLQGRKAEFRISLLIMARRAILWDFCAVFLCLYAPKYIEAIVMELGMKYMEYMYTSIPYL
jgi:hypothetical protein